MLVKPCFRKHSGWEFGNNCSAGRHFNRLKAIFRWHAVRHLRSPWPEKAARSMPGMGSRRQNRILLSHERPPRRLSTSVVRDLARQTPEMAGQPSFCGLPGDEACKLMAAQRTSLDRLNDLKAAQPVSRYIVCCHASNMAPRVKGSTWKPPPSRDMPAMSYPHSKSAKQSKHPSPQR